jgi:hypothetical protein
VIDQIKTFEAEHAHTSNLLRTASMLTQKHLASILSDLPKAPALAPAPAASPSAPAPAALPSAAAAPAPASVVTPAVPAESSTQAGAAKVTQDMKRERDEKSTAVDEAARKKMKLDAQRRERVKQMTMGRNAATVASAPRPDARPASQPIISQGPAMPAAASLNPSRTASQVLSRPPAVAYSNPSSSSSDALPSNWSIWLNKPRVISASEERFAPVTGNEFFFLKPIAPSNAVSAPAGAVPPGELQQDRGREGGARKAASHYAQDSNYHAHESRQPQRRDNSMQEGFRPRRVNDRLVRSNDRSFQSSHPHPRDGREQHATNQVPPRKPAYASVSGVSHASREAVAPPSSLGADQLPDNYSIWLNRLRTISTSEETFAPVTGNEFFYLKPLPPPYAKRPSY